MKTKAILTFALLIAANLVQAQTWVPPKGIPAPPFGITEVAGPATLYVSDSGSDSNPGTSASAPKKTIPGSLSAGTVLTILGTYSTKHDGSIITANGTLAAPVFIRGTSTSVRPTVNQKWNVNGSYYIIEYINFTWANSSGNGKLNFGSDHGVVRHCDARGDLGDGIGGVNPVGSNMVIWDNKLHDFGDINIDKDQDVHGVSVSRAHHVWVLDNEISRVSGDGIQINDGGIGAAANAGTHHIYFGRNVTHHNKQSGFWAKASSDVIFSQNTAFSMIRTSGSSEAQCAGTQYGPDRVWFIENHLYDCAYGIFTGSGSGGSGKDHFYIANEIHNIHSPAKNPLNSWAAGACIMDASPGNRAFVGNTCTDADAGIMLPGPTSNRAVDNILWNVGRQLWLDGAGTLSSTNNLLGPVVNVVGTTGITCPTCVMADPKFVGAADLHLQASSPAIDKGALDPAYALFQSLYGISIQYDYDGNARPAGVAWDLGAQEFGGVPVTPPPSTPTPPGPTPTPPVSTPTPTPPAATPSPVIPGACLNDDGTLKKTLTIAVGGNGANAFLAGVLVGAVPTGSNITIACK